MSGLFLSLSVVWETVLDLYIIRRRDSETPVEERLAALNDLAKAGKARALGASVMYGDHEAIAGTERKQERPSSRLCRIRFQAMSMQLSALQTFCLRFCTPLYCVGISTEMEVPFSELSSTQTEPPWRPAISHTRESPSPAPPCSLLRDLSTRKKGWKMLR